MRTDAAAGGIVIGPEGKVVLVQQHNNSWSFPKGGVEEGETLLEAAERETAEESGLTDLEFVEVLGSYERKSIGLGGVGETDVFGSRTRTFFLFRTKSLELAPTETEGEITDTRWVTLDEASTMLTHPKDKEFFASIRTKVEAAL